MSDTQPKSRPQESEIESWARALGVSPQRLIALVEEVVNERLSLAVPLVPAKAPGQQ